MGYNHCYPCIRPFKGVVTPLIRVITRVTHLFSAIHGVRTAFLTRGLVVSAHSGFFKDNLRHVTSLKPPIPRPSSSTMFTKSACDVVSGRGQVPGIFQGLPKVLNKLRDAHICIYFAGMEFPMCAAAF